MDEQEQTTQAPLTDVENKPIQDGAIPQDSNAVGSENYDAIGISTIDIKFDKGNFQQITALPSQIEAKVNAVVKTLVPLIEVALIELSGSSQSYHRDTCQITPSFDAAGQFLVDFNIIYTLPGYIATDVNLQDLQSDASYIMQRIQPTNMNFTKCEIDTSQGTVHICGSVDKPQQEGQQ